MTKYELVGLNVPASDRRNKVNSKSSDPKATFHCWILRSLLPCALTMLWIHGQP